MSLVVVRAHTLTVSGGRLLAENIADARMGRSPAIELPFGLERIEMCTLGTLFRVSIVHDHRERGICSDAFSISLPLSLSLFCPSRCQRVRGPIDLCHAES